MSESEQPGSAIARLEQLRQDAGQLPEGVRERFESELQAAITSLRNGGRDPATPLAQVADFPELLIRSSVDGILAFDQRCRYTVWNPVMETITGLTAGQVLHKNAFEVFPFLKETGEDVAFQDTLAGKQVERMDRPYRVPQTGKEGFFEAHYSPLRSAQGEIVGGLSIVRDITQRKDTERLAVEAERLSAVAQMITGLAHECRNALQRSQACLDVLSLKIGDRPEVGDLIARIQLAQDHLRDLYEEVREYASPIRLNPQSCDLQDILHQAWADLAPLQTQKQARLVEEGMRGARCKVDPKAMKRVFHNVLENSLSVGNAPVEVSVTWAERDEEGLPAPSVVVVDNGPGLTEEERKRIFEPFYTTKPKGTGLGLAVAKRLVEAHGGRIAARPCSRGAEIYIDLPRGAYEPFSTDRDRG